MPDSPFRCLSRYGGGSEIKLTLDFMVKNVTFSASIDNGHPYQMFCNLLDCVPKNERAAGFVPAISIEGKGSTQNASFEKV
mmetsp:Transcript_11897/g.15905  ORF Transcript_11897/g.15905 Transcript_11897/m.15905 type:complete len:81 (+) Transcript_11897:104-346(+)